MAKLTQIDRTKPLMLNGSKKAETTDPEIVKLAKQMNLPQMLYVDEPVGERVQIPASETATFLDHVSQPEWRPSFEDDLQGLCETAKGEPLLSTWLSIESFREFAESLCGLSFQSGLLGAVQAWETLGADTVYLDGYERVCESI